METTTTTTTTTTWVSRLWHGSEAVYTPLHNKAKGALSMVQSSTRGVVVLFLLLLAFVAFISTRWIDGNTLNSWSQQALSALSRPPSPPPPPPKPQPIPISLNCPIPSDQKPTAPTCRRPPSPAPAPSSASHSNLPHRAESSGPSCPAYFRWIHEDLRPWNAGITRELLESGRKHATFRLVVLDGRVYIDKYRGTFQTRDVFTIWGILQLVARYPGRVPDLDLMFDCDDFPAVRTVFYRDSTPPPVFHYCKDDGTVDILFPDWSFWGWTETNIKPWNTLMEDLKEANERVNWSDRIPYAFWRGNPMMGGHRQDLMKCNASNGQDWGARLYVQDWIAEMIKGNGYKNSNLANQCAHRYKIFVEGIAWSVSQKYIMACNSPTLYITPHFYEFFTRGLMPMQHYWPIDEKHKCRSIKSAVDWGNQHPQEAEAMGRAGSGFMQEDLKMDYVYDYMLHLLTEYAKLLKYKPTLPVNATEICMESVACNAMGGVKKYMMESMVKETHVEEPCTLPPAFTAQEFQDLAARKSNATKQVEMWEERIWDKKDNQTRTLNSWSQQALRALSHTPPSPPPKPQPISISLNCPIPSGQKPAAPTCRRPPAPAPAPSSASHLNLPHQASTGAAAPESSGPSCPAYFRWIHEDLRPWNATGISRELLESGRNHATFRLVVLEGRVYMDKYRGTFQTRDVFTIWGILQLVSRYPGRVPDLDLMFDCGDSPVVRTALYRDSTPPPVFHYCKDDGTVDILFPDWSFWGWPETNIRPWNTLMEDLKEANGRVNWSDRIPYAFWKGNPLTGGHRKDLMKCNTSNGQDWGAHLYVQDWTAEKVKGHGFHSSNLADQCVHSCIYKIFVEGVAWSASQKYISSCNSPTLSITPHFYEFFSRGLMPKHHYWSIDQKHKCRSIKSAVDWGNQHPQEAQAMGRAGSGFMQEDVKMDYVYDYMLHLLTQYAKLLTYKPTVPETATEICTESMACNAMGGVKKFMMESMVKETRVEPPCTLPPAFSSQEFEDLAAQTSNAAKQVEMWEEQIWDEKDNKTRA